MDLDRFADLLDAFLRPALKAGDWSEIQAAQEKVLKRARQRMDQAGIPVREGEAALRSHMESLIQSAAGISEDSPSASKASARASSETGQARTPRAVSPDDIIEALKGVAASAREADQRRQGRLNLSLAGFDRAEIDQAEESLLGAIGLRLSRANARSRSQPDQAPDTDGPSAPDAQDPSPDNGDTSARSETLKEKAQKAARDKAAQAKEELHKARESLAPQAQPLFDRLKAAPKGAKIGIALAAAALVIGIPMLSSSNQPTYRPSSTPSLTLTAVKSKPTPKIPEADKWVAYHRFSDMYKPEIAAGDKVALYFGHTQYVKDVFESAENRRLYYQETASQCWLYDEGIALKARILTPRAVLVELRGDEIEIGFDTPQEAIAATEFPGKFRATSNRPNFSGSAWIMDGDMTKSHLGIYIEVSPGREGDFRQAFPNCRL